MHKQNESKLKIFSRFYRGSKKYFFSALGFPPEVRENVATVYNFCRYVDDVVDEPGKYPMTLSEFIDQYNHCLTTGICDLSLIEDFINLKKELDFHDEWIEGLFNSMKMDSSGFKYMSIKDTLKYTYGVSEVIGLFMSKVLNIPEEAYPYAIKLGRAAQWINFIRDIDEDNKMGRCYFPESDLKNFNLKNLEYSTALKHPQNFKNFLNYQIDKYFEYANEGEKGYVLIPDKYLKPVIYSTEIDKWKARVIRENPFVIYRRKVEPSYIKIFIEIIKANRSVSLKEELEINS